MISLQYRLSINFVCSFLCFSKILFFIGKKFQLFLNDLDIVELSQTPTRYFSSKKFKNTYFLCS
jgi:hypothetical protein